MGIIPGHADISALRVSGIFSKAGISALWRERVNNRGNCPGGENVGGECPGWGCPALLGHGLLWCYMYYIGVHALAHGPRRIDEWLLRTAKRHTVWPFALLIWRQLVRVLDVERSQRVRRAWPTTVVSHGWSVCLSMRVVPSIRASATTEPTHDLDPRIYESYNAAYYYSAPATACDLLLCHLPLGEGAIRVAIVRPSVCPSVAYIANNSRTQRPSVPKFGKKVAHLRCDSHTSFKV